MGISVTSKAELRKTILEQRTRLTEAEKKLWDQQILELVSSLKLESHGTVYCYISVRGETGTEGLIERYLKQGARVAVPRVKGRNMDFYYIRSLEDLEPGCFGIPEPSPKCELAAALQAPVIVPGVAFSERFERTGYGAGYYDRFFEREPFHRKAAVCYDFQLSPAIQSEPHDILMDDIITPTRFLQRK